MAHRFPDTWQLLPLEDCMDAIIDYRGKTPKKAPFGIPLVTAKVVKDGRILDEPREYIAFDDYDSWMRRGIPRPGDVVMTTEAPLGEIAQLDERKVALAQRLITLRGKPGLLDNNYLKFLMQSRFVQHELEARATGTTVVGIRQKELRKAKLIIPPLAEQQAMAHILGTLDNKIELNYQMNQTLEAIARAIFKSWFVDFDPVWAKVDGEQPYGMDAETAALFPDAFTDSSLGQIPQGWRVGTFDELIEIIGGGTPKTSVPEYWNGDIPWFSVKDLPTESDVYVIDTERKVTQAGVDNSSTKVLPEGTTIITARGTVGKLALVGIPMAMNQTCYGIRGSDRYPDLFTFFHLRSIVSELQQRTHGTVFDTITRNTFTTIETVIPPVEIAQAFDDRVKPMLRLIRMNLFQSQTLAELRDNLLPKLISGQLRAPDVERFVENAL